MNKIKLFYDVITTLKDKEVINGTFKAEGKRDLNKIFSCENEFTKNMVDGQTKANINMEVDCEGKKVKHQSSTEFNVQGCHHGMHRGFMGHMQHHHAHGFHHCGKFGMKEKLNRMAVLLNIFNSIKVDEKADGAVVLSLTLDEIPEGMKKAIQERRMHHEHLKNSHSEYTHHSHHGLIKEFHNADLESLALNVCINANKEVEKVTFQAAGKQKDETDVLHEINVEAEVNLTW